MTQSAQTTPLMQAALSVCSQKQPPFSPKKGTEVVYVYGFGLRAHDVKRWLRKDRRHQLVVIEDQKKSLDCFGPMTDSIQLLEEPQVKLVQSDKKGLEEGIGQGLLRPSEFLTMPGKNRLFASHFFDLKMNLEHRACLYRDYGALCMENILQNGVRPALEGHALKNSLRNIPAIICGAGPSLKKNLDVLKTVEKKAAIFVGGSALPLLMQEKVAFDFGGSIDPNAPSRPFPMLDCPLFFQNQTTPALLNKTKGPLIRMGPSGALDVERWLTSDLTLFDGGTHVGTFLTHVAHFLGCTPIIFVGMDGCYSNQVYFGGKEGNPKKGNVATLDRFGNAAFSRSDFLLGRRFLEHFAKTHPQTVFLNATEGGLEMEGIAQKRLIAIRDEYLNRSFDLSDLLQKKLPRAGSLHKAALKNSLIECQKICADLPFFSDQNLRKEVFYQFVLRPNWRVWRFFLQRRDLVEQMVHPRLEKRVQRLLFFRTVCEHYKRFLSKE